MHMMYCEVIKSCTLYYEGRPKIKGSYFIMLAHDIEADVGVMAVELEPSCQ
jgi:hypothetical protein